MIITDVGRTAIITLVSNAYNYCAFFTNFDLPTGQETISNRNVLAKKALTKVISANGNLSLTCELTTSDANCPSTTVASDAGNSKSQIKLTSATGFRVGDRIKIGTESDRKILTLAGSIITFDNLTAIPANGTAVKIRISQRAIIRGGTSSLSDGEIDAIETFIKDKNSSITLPVYFSGVL